MRQSRHRAAQTDRRRAILDGLARLLASEGRTHPLRVAIDGVDCAGKTVLADELSVLLASRGKCVIRATIDGFHNPRDYRYRHGGTPRSYYQDSFDYRALHDGLLDPLGPNGDLRYTAAVFDYAADRPIVSPLRSADRQAVLLFDGVFLLRPQLEGHWDFRLYVHASFATVLERAVARDAGLFGGEAETRRRYVARYIPGQMIYLRECEPHLRAEVVVDNDDASAPRIVSADERESLLLAALKFSP